MTLEEMRAALRVLAKHESPADRYFALAALWDLAGLLRLAEDRGMPLADAYEMRRELTVLLAMLEPNAVEDDRVAVQLALARLDHVQELPPQTPIQPVTASRTPDVIDVSAHGAVRPEGELAIQVIKAEPSGGAGQGRDGAPSNSHEKPPSDVRSRRPTPAEAHASGVLGASTPGQHQWWEHRHYPLRDGRWGSEVHVFADDGNTLSVMPLYPAGDDGYFLTADEARRYNTGMARAYFTANTTPRR